MTICEDVEFVIWRTFVYGPPDTASPFNSGGEHLIQVIPSDMMIPTGWTQKWGRLALDHDGPIPFHFGPPNQEANWRLTTARVAGETIYHVLPHREVGDPAFESRHLQWVRDHATLDAARDEAKRLCDVGWSAHIWVDGDPHSFVESWEGGPEGPILSPNVFIRWDDRAERIYTYWMNR